MLNRPEHHSEIPVGILLPQSKAYPQAAAHFVEGIKLYFTVHPNDFPRGKVVLDIKNIGQGSVRQVEERLQEMLLDRKPVLLGGMLEPTVGSQVAAIARESKLPCLFSGLGETALSPEEKQDNLFLHTLHLWQSSYLLGKQAALRYRDKPFLLITSFFDSGYDPNRAFHLGLQSQGADFAERIILRSENLEELNEELAGCAFLNDQFVPVCILHPRLLELFTDRFGDMFSQMVITPFYEGNNGKEKLWAFPQWKKEDDSFLMLKKGAADYLQLSEPDMFHFLGYEHGKLIAHAVKRLDEPKDDYQTVIDEMQDYEEGEEKGRLAMNSVTHHLDRPMHLFKGMNCISNYEIAGSFSINDIAFEDIGVLFEPHASFTNPYLFY
ncbi:MAG: hypothetical protein MI784_01535 [Cytophagales bacterium]|nr:hypothetical protein [Cytophagales bacterium]